MYAFVGTKMRKKVLMLVFFDPFTRFFHFFKMSKIQKKRKKVQKIAFFPVFPYALRHFLLHLCYTLIALYLSNNTLK